MRGLRDIGIKFFFGIAGLGFAAAMLSGVQTGSQRGFQMARAAGPYVRAAGWVAIAVLSLVLLGLVFYAVYRFRIDHQERKIEMAGKAAATVTQISDGLQTWLVNPLRLPVSNASHDWRLVIDDREPEPMPDQWQVIRALKFLESKQPKRININNDMIEGLLAPPMLDLLPSIIGLPNLLIVGGKGTGKTTLMQWLAMERAKMGKVLVFDSHDHPAKWPAGDVIGNGRNYETIWQAMMTLVKFLDQRYKEFAAGVRLTGQFDRIDNFIDEFTLLPSHIKDLGGNVQQYSKPLLTEGRKVDLNLTWGIHSDKVDALGLRGASDLKECFDAIVYLKNVNGDRYALVDFGEGVNKESPRYRLPGPFMMTARPERLSAPVDMAEAAPMTFEVSPEVEQVEHDNEPERPSEFDDAVLVAYYQNVVDNDGKPVWAQICKALDLTPGTHQYNKLKAIIRKWTSEEL